MFNIIFNLKEWSNVSIVPSKFEFTFIISKYNELFDKAFCKFFVWFLVFLFDMANTVLCKRLEPILWHNMVKIRNFDNWASAPVLPHLSLPDNSSKIKHQKLLYFVYSNLFPTSSTRIAWWKMRSDISNCTKICLKS